MRLAALISLLTLLPLNAVCQTVFKDGFEEPPKQVEIYGIDLNDDGVAEIIDQNGDGAFDLGVGASCSSSYPREVILLTHPEVIGTFNNGTLTPNMVFKQETGKTTFTSHCGQIRQRYIISYSFTPEVGETSQPMTLLRGVHCDFSNAPTYIVIPSRLAAFNGILPRN